MTEVLGKTIGEYQLIQLIGETDNAIVYKGFQPSLNRYVTVKVLKPSASRDPALIQQFLQQAELGKRMQHPNILPVFDFGQSEGITYQVQQFIETGTLHEQLFKYRDPIQASVLMEGIIDGLEYIHSQGYVHGNLKPENVFLDQAGHPLLADFGIQHQVGRAVNPYLAPEQVQGGVVDNRVDVYGLGILLYELMVGQAPPAGMIVSPRSQRADLTEAVERVILKASAQNPDQRYRTVRDFGNELSMAVHKPVVVAAPPPTPVTQPGISQTVQVTQPRSTNWLAIILGVVLVIILCVGGYFGYQLLTGASGTAPAPAETQPPEEPTQPPEQPTQPPEEPTQPPEQPQPTEPGQPPEGGGGDLGNIFEQLCGSLGLAGGAIVLSGYRLNKKRKQRI